MAQKMKIQIERRYWVLLALASTEGSVFTPVQLQKTIFLIGERLGVSRGKDFYKFSPYDYGPFTPEVYRDAEILENEGLINIGYAPNLRWKMYSVLPKGVEFANELIRGIPTETVQKITEITNLVLNLSFKELIEEVYEEFPEYSGNSVFRG